jgi:acetyltransferase-like isoleucine patch superfamily enzyme
VKLLSLFNPLSYYVFFRKRSLLKRFRRVGTNFLFDPLSTILTPEHIEIGDNVFIGERAHISAEVTVGNNVMFGPRPMLIGGDHYFAVRGKSVRFLHPRGRENVEPIRIEDEAWFGAGVIILGNVVAGMGCVVGAGSLVSKSIPPFTVAVGNPCRPVKRIFNDEMLFDHLTKLTGDEALAAEIVSRRQRELRALGHTDLVVIDKTDLYWETRPH